jgi:hypothetical protein
MTLVMRASLGRLALMLRARLSQLMLEQRARLVRLLLVLHLRLGRLALVLRSRLSHLMLELGTHALGLAPVGKKGGRRGEHLHAGARNACARPRTCGEEGGGAPW